MTPPSIRNGEICRLLSPWPSSWQLLLAEEVARRMEAEPGVVFEELVAAFELTVIERALNVTGGCRHRAARLLGIGRNTIARKIDRLRIGDGDSVKLNDPFTPVGLTEFCKEKI